MKKMKTLIAMFLVMGLAIANPVQVKAEGAVYKDDTAVTAADSLKPVIATSGTTEEVSGSVQLIQIKTSGTKTYTMPLIAEKDGLMDLYLQTENTNPSGTISYNITSDLEGTEVVYEGTFESQDADHLATVKVAKGTYYLNLTLESTDIAVETADIYFYGIIYPSGDQNLKDKDLIAVSGLEKGTFYKYTASTAGYLAFSASAESDVTITLYDSAKKAVSKATTIYTKEDVAQFAVDKGTYYFKVKTNSEVAYLIAGIEKIKDNAGSSASKAKAIKVNSDTEGLVTTKDKKGKVDYYQINVSKVDQLKGIYVDFVGTGSVKVTIKIPGLKAKSATVKSGTYITHYLTETMKNNNGSYYRDGKYPKGTYTITVEKTNTKSSGVYTIKTKKVD